jgi:hypothetical protein
MRIFIDVVIPVPPLAGVIQNFFLSSWTCLSASGGIQDLVFSTVTFLEKVTQKSPAGEKL